MTVKIRGVETIAGLFFLAVTAGVFLVSAGFPEARGARPGPAFFPRVIAACIAVLAVAQIARDRLFTEDEVYEVSTTAVKRVLVPLVVTGAYVWVLSLTGFLVGTVLYLVVLLAYSGITSPRVVLPYSLGIAVALQYVFGSFLHIPLPEGVVPIAELLPAVLSAGVVG